MCRAYGKDLGSRVDFPIQWHHLWLFNQSISTICVIHSNFSVAASFPGSSLSILSTTNFLPLPRYSNCDSTLCEALLFVLILFSTPLAPPRCLRLRELSDIFVNVPPSLLPNVWPWQWLEQPTISWSLFFCPELRSSPTPMNTLHICLIAFPTPSKAPLWGESGLRLPKLDNWKITISCK